MACDQPLKELDMITVQKQYEIKSLTGLRGIAAVYVMPFHFKFSNFTSEFIKQFFDHGYLAVDIFFVLGGFIMVLTYKSLFQKWIFLFCVQRIYG